TSCSLCSVSAIQTSPLLIAQNVENHFALHLIAQNVENHFALHLIAQNVENHFALPHCLDPSVESLAHSSATRPEGRNLMLAGFFPTRSAIKLARAFWKSRARELPRIRVRRR